VQKCGETPPFLARLFRAFAAFPTPKIPKISQIHNRVFPLPHDKNLYNFEFKLLDILYFTFSVFEPTGRAVVEISIFASEFE
jgi:hypothetical protein